MLKSNAVIKESNSQKKIIIGGGGGEYGYNPRSKRSDVGTRIVEAVEEVGLTIDIGTVRKWLNCSSELLDQETLDDLDS